MKRFQLLRGSVAGPIVFGLFVLMASGCSTIRGPQADDPYFAPATAPEPEPDFANAGGIAYARFGNSLFSDAQARHVGDILTVLAAQSRVLQFSGQLISLRRLRLDNRVNLHLALGGDFRPNPNAR